MGSDVAAACGQLVVERKEKKVVRTVWESKLLANEHPTYYGMAVASISKK